jgi:hypothetical protein
MRYHWGLGVGHLHVHQTQKTPDHDGDPATPEAPWVEDSQADQTSDCILVDLNVRSENNMDAHPQEEDSDMCCSDNSEFGLDDRQLEGWEDVESDDEGEDFGDGVDDEDMDVEDFGGI